MNRRQRRSQLQEDPTPSPTVPINRPHPIGSPEALAARNEAARLDAEAKLESVVSRLDRWENWATGIGTFEDKTRHSHFAPPFRLTDAEITALASGNDLAAKAIEKRPAEMFRRGYVLEPDGGDEVDKSVIEDLRKFSTEQLQLDVRMRQGMVFGRQYGGSVLILGINDGGYPWEPVDESRIKSIDFINQVDRRFAYVQSYYSDSMSPKYGEPQTYLVANAVATSTYRSRDNAKFRIKKTVTLDPDKNSIKDSAGGYSILNIHESRIIRFDGIEPDVLTRQQLAGWSWSIIQRAYETLRLCDMAFDSLAYLISDASQGVMKLKGLLKGLSMPGQRQAIEQRLKLVDESRSVLRSIALDPDGGEDFTRVATPLTGIPDAVDRLMQRLAAAFDMPVTELFGISPAGLNATGESDRIHWYDTIATDQENTLAPRMKRLYRLISLAKEGPLKGKDINWKIKFNPLHSPTEDEIAKTRFTNAQRDQIYLETTVLRPEEVAVTLTDVYPHLDVESREEALNMGKKLEPYPNEPDPAGPAGTSGGIGEAQATTVPLPGSALHTAASPAGEGQGTPGDAGTGNPRLGPAGQVTPGQPSTRKEVPPNAAQTQGQPGTKATAGGGAKPADDIPTGKGVPHVVVHLPDKGKPAVTLHASKGKAREAAKDLANKKGGEARVLPATDFLAKQGAWRAKNQSHPETGRFVKSKDEPETKKDWDDLLSLDAADPAELPDDFGVAVPRSGSHCSNCSFLASSNPPMCGNDTFAGWVKLRTGEGTGTAPAPIPAPQGDPALYCCSAWHAAPGALKADALPVAPTDVGAEPPALTPKNDPQPVPLPDASIGIIRNGNRVLVVKAKKGWRSHIWALPGGESLPNESPDATLRRELAEEVGVVATEIELATDIICPTDGRLVHVFYVKSFLGELRPDRDEVRTLRWMMPVGLMGASGRWYKTVHQLILNGVLGGKAEMDGPAGPTGRMLAAAFEAAGLSIDDFALHNTQSHADSAWMHSDANWDVGDEDALDRLDSMTFGRSDGTQAGEVFRQLLPDYAAKHLGWVLAANWHGPDEIPRDQIDFSKRDSWKASHDGKTPKHVELMKAGESPPAILVKLPSGKFMIVDGHHRALASEALDRPVNAYWADVQVPNGPWTVLHGLQKKGSSGGSISGDASWSVENQEPPAAASVSTSPKDAVQKQLSHDFPDSATAWAKDAEWVGPTQVPLDQIDFSKSDTWRSKKEPGKVERFQKQIESGKEKPVVLVRRPGMDKLMVADGHHHSLAYQKLGKDVTAYIATVKSKTGPWDTMHSAQHEGEFVPKADATMLPARAGDVVAGPAVVGALEDLLCEHALLRRILAIYRKAAALIRAGQRPVPQMAALLRAARLFRSFGEDYHERAIEETHIFPIVRPLSDSLHALVGKLTSEHAKGRLVTDALLQTGAAGQVIDDMLSGSLESFAEMYERHASDEETVVFPAWAKALGPEKLTAAGELFERIERDALGPEGFDGAERAMAEIEAEFNGSPEGGDGGSGPAPSAKTDAIGGASDEETWLAENITQAVVEALEAYVKDLPEDKADDFDESKVTRDPHGMFAPSGAAVMGAGREAGTEAGSHGLRGALHAAIARLRGAPAAIGQAAIHEVKAKIREFKNAGLGVKAFLSGHEVTPEQKSAIKKVAVSIAASILASHLTPLVPLAHVVHAELGAKVVEKVTDQVMHHVIEFLGAKGLHLDAIVAAAALAARADDFDESKHPRAPNGQFGEGGGSEGNGPKAPSAGAGARRTFTDKPPAGLSGKQTVEEHYKDGAPTAERKETIHDPIVRAALDGVHQPPEGAPKVAYFTMGAPGSGKSAGLRNIDVTQFVKVDPDAIKEKLPEYQAAVADRGATYRGAAAMVHEEASDIAKRVMREALASGKHVLVDGTGVSAESLTKKMEQARAAGYHVHLAFSHLGDEKEGARRIALRAEKTGRTVPDDYIHHAYEAVPRNFAEVAKHADTFEVHDSSKPDSPITWSKSPEGEHLADPDFVRGFKEKYQGHTDAADWDEEKHPRDPSGRFGSGGEGGAASGGSSPRAASPKEFKAAFDKAFAGDEHSGFVSHYSEEQLAGMKTFLSADGKTGVALHDHGDGRIEATALFNKGGPPGAGTAMMRTAIANGANYCECFGDVLRGKYESLGFKVDTKSDFNPEYAPKDWNYEKFERPPYYTLKLPSKKDAGDWDESKHPRGPGGKFGSGEGGGSSDTPKAGSATARSPAEHEAASLADAAMKETSLDARNAKLKEAIDSLPGATPLPQGYGHDGKEDPLMGAKSDDDFEARSIEGRRRSRSSPRARSRRGRGTRTASSGDSRRTPPATPRILGTYPSRTPRGSTATCNARSTRRCLRPASSTAA